MELHTDQMQVSIAPMHQENISASEQAEIRILAEKNENASEPAKTDQVTISQEAREKSINDKNQAAMRKILGNEEADETNNEGQSTLDEKIAELQEKIAQLTAEIAQERRSGDEEKVKSMEIELASLHAQLLQLIEQKLEGDKILANGTSAAK